jgi:hypothetical protein
LRAPCELAHDRDSGDRVEVDEDRDGLAKVLVAPLITPTLLTSP